MRGAIAAANRHTADELLAQPTTPDDELGEDGNLPFSPPNAEQHRVNVAVTLGDAGTACKWPEHRF